MTTEVKSMPRLANSENSKGICVLFFDELIYVLASKKLAMMEW